MTKVGAGKTQRAQQREETRRRVYEAALTIFRRDGVDGARIEDIVKLAGVSNGTFYFHFPTKDDVLATLLSESTERVMSALEELPERATLEKVLETICRRMADEWREDKALFTAVGMVAIRLTAQGSGTPFVIPQALVPRFERAAARGELQPNLPAELMAQFFLLNVFAAMLTGCSNPAIPLEAALAGATRLFLDGARPRSDVPQKRATKAELGS